MPRTTSRKPTEPQTPGEAPSLALTVRPLTAVEPAKPKSTGRPAKPVMPELPLMPMTEVERELFNFFMDSYKEQYPDLTPTDILILHLAALEYIKYLRVVAEELQTGKVISMARQHPGVQMRAHLDSLSVTRKARTARGQKEEDPEAKEIREFFMQKPKPGPSR